jgi:light-regulated signal transduction histidine kinase (bacteriophytochrome)
LTDELQPVDLTNCDREPIHQIGTVQPFGFLLTLSSDWLISRASVNIEAFLGVPHSQILGRPLTQLLSSNAVHALRNRLASIRGQDFVERVFGLVLQDEGDQFDIALHLVDGQIVLEGEPSLVRHDGGTMPIRSMTARLDQADTLQTFFREGARQTRALTGFDRVMIYRFGEDGAGEVVAEAARPGIGSFLGLHYPASDIPVQARALYLRNIFRIIADVDAVPVSIAPSLDERGQPLDLSMSVLRSVSPIHIEYLKNMGVAASLSISIVVEGKLWGLFACHHYTPRLPSFERRSTAELLGQIFAAQLESRERRIALEYERKAKQIADRLLTSVAGNASLLDDPAWLIEAIADVIPADGIGVWINGRTALSGAAVTPEQFSTLTALLNRNAAGRIFATDNIDGWYQAWDNATGICGLLAIPISRSPRDYVILFRQEIVRSVHWAGNPEKPFGTGPNGPRLTPRKSFETWSETVRGRSLPFTAPEQRVAETIRVALIEVVLRLSEEASTERRIASERQELLIAELNHRVRNILSLIGGLIRHSKSNNLSVDDYIDHLQGRVQSLSRAHDQLTRDQWAPASFRHLLEAESAAYLGKTSGHVDTLGPDVLLDPKAFSTAALVFHELVTNSVKYGALSGNGTVSVGWETDEFGNLRIAWREAGGPPVTQPSRSGFGSTIIRRSIVYDLDGQAEIRFPPGGVEADFLIPEKFVTFVAHVPELSRDESESFPPADTPVDEPLAGMTILLVEDNLIIAMNGEDILSSLGAREVIAVPNLAQAFEIVDGRSLQLALLDVNLGDETSLPIADRLRTLDIPFAFVTGYGESIPQSENYRDIPVLQKPYTPESIAAFLPGIIDRKKM